MSTSPGRTYQSAKSYFPSKEFKKSAYVNASNAMGKPYKGGIRLCIGCNNKSVSSQNDLLRQPGEVEISFLPNGKVFRINRGYPRSLEWGKPTYSAVLSSMQKSFGSPSFKLQTEGYAEIGWHYYEGSKSGPLESWFWDKKPNSTSLLQLRDAGVLFPRGYYSEQELRRENPKSTYCLSQHFADGGTTGWGRYFLFEGPRMDVMYRVEHKSFEQVQREAATWVAPGYTKNCGPLIFATVGFPDAEMWKNNERTSTKDYGRDIPTGGLSMTMIDVPALDEWKNSERREIEAYIRSSK